MSVVSPSGLYRKDKPVTDWPSIRRWVLNRDKQLCQICLVREATDVDHIWPRRLGGQDHVDNLRAACGPCNKMKSARVRLADATDEQLWLGADALRARIDELEAELEDLERMQFVRAMRRHSPESAVSSLMLRALADRAGADYRLACVKHVSESVRSESEEGAPA